MSADLFSGAPSGLYTVLGSLSEDAEHLKYLTDVAFSQVFPSGKCLKQFHGQENQEWQESAVTAISFLFRNAVKLGFTSDKFEKQLQSNSSISASLVEVVINTWNQKESIRKSEALKLINVGKLVDLQWKFGVAVTSNTCKALKMPYITMVITVADSSSSLMTKSFDMDLQEFRNFSKQMKDMASAFETM